MNRTTKHVVNALEKLFNFFASIQLAIIVLSGLAIICAVGTIVEARYDSNYAQKMVYQSPYMYLIMALLCVNLLNVMIDRLPWKARHTGFVLAHIGIIVIVVGALITKKYGIDGSMALNIDEKSRSISLSENELAIYTSLGEGTYKHMYSSTQDFLLSSPRNNPISVTLDRNNFKVTDYYHYSLREQKIIESQNPYDGPAVRLQLQNANINITEWLSRAVTAPYETFDLGPARIVLAEEKAKVQNTDGNVIVLRPDKKDKIRYEIYTKSKSGLTKSGLLPLAEAIDTGWMDIKLRLLKYLPRAENKIKFTEKTRPTGMTSPAIKIEFNDKAHWVGLNSPLQLYTDVASYVVAYRNRLLDLGFDMSLKQFTVGRYQGTNRAMSYESIVNVSGLGERHISMNEPLKYRGYTFYQASFQENDQGEATTSILSVNKDPGRPVKYFGFFFVVLGTIFMFYFKRFRAKLEKVNKISEGQS
ncbi:MAG: hypothetical protein A2Z20_08885 [Bdellovibrionales bacterium RBG_16_40_8]|nr:MAG: hypothetical protein A2Z20_08885 [Bdellovibrionales bacterium RBG_16_40_8]